MIRCPSCGQDSAEAAAYCQRCGVALGNPFVSPSVAIPQAVMGQSMPGQSIPGQGSETVATIIPYRNAGALAAYYLGLFSCFPVLGFPLAIIALVCGIQGLKAVRRNPAAHGTAHAWVGLICGTIGFLINGLIILAIGLALMAGAGR
jgi:hypothetical protein